MHDSDVSTDDLSVRVNAATYFTLDQQLIPTAQRHVGGSGIDLRAGLPIARVDLNHCYGQFSTVDGRSHHVLQAPDGRTRKLSSDEDFAYVQVHIGPDFSRRDVDGERCATARANAIEPMIALPGALNSGLGLCWVEPGDTWETSWGLTLLPPGLAPV